jgi:hypothetical protein
MLHRTVKVTFMSWKWYAQQCSETATVLPKGCKLVSGKTLISSACVLALMSAPVAAVAARDEKSAGAALAPLLECRKLTDATARLGCFDTQAAVLDSATSKHEVVVIDAAEARRVKRSLFGFNVPDLNLLGGKREGAGAEQREEETELRATIAQASQRSNGRWFFVLDDGATWVQVDSIQFRADPKPGDAIRIRKAAMGSYLANVNKQLAVRVQRENR